MVSEKKKTKPLSLRQKRVARQIISDEAAGIARPAKEILLKSGYSELTAETPHKVLNSESMREEMAKNGFGPDFINRKLKEAADAKIVAVYQGTATETDAPDHATRLRALSLAGDFAGLKSVNVRQTNVNLNLSDDEARSLLGFS